MKINKFLILSKESLLCLIKITLGVKVVNKFMSIKLNRKFEINYC